MPDPPTPPPTYGPDLARIHHEHFGGVARGAARELLARLRRAGLQSGTVVDLAAGSGILSRAVTEAGYAAWGVDLSDDMLAIARREAPAATFLPGSLWTADVPPCVAVAAVGEAFCYATGAAVTDDAVARLRRRLRELHDALVPGGLLLFDVASPGRSGPSGVRRSFWSHEQAHLGLEEVEDPRAGRLTRTITLFVPEGDRHRRVQETHVLRLLAPDAVEQCLAEVGFDAERLAAYDDFAFLPGWHGFVATRRG